MTLEQVKGWLAPQLASAAARASSLIGDLDPDQALEIARDTFGRLPDRRPLERHEDRRKVDGPQSGIDLRDSIDTETAKGLVALVFPTTDGFELVARVQLDMLGRILADRVLQTVRERLGAAYSPYAFSRTSTVHPGDGMLMIQAQGDPQRIDELLEACLSVSDALASGGTTAEEVDRLREPALKQIRDAQRTNGYWSGVTLDAMHGRPQALDDSRKVLDAYRAVTPDELNELAAKYLPRERASRLIVTPRGP